MNIVITEATWSCLFLAGVVIGVGGSEDIASQLAPLKARYSAFEAATVRFETVIPEDGGRTKSFGRHTVNADGSLSALYWLGVPTTDEPTSSSPPTTYKFRTATEMVLPHTSRAYVRLGPGDFPGGVFPPDYQAYLMAPWPRISGWCKQLVDANDTVVVSHDGVSIASSDSLGLGLSWTPRGRLVAVRTGSKLDWREHEFVDWSAESPETPRAIIQRIMSQGKRRPDVRWSYRSVEMGDLGTQGDIDRDTYLSKLDRYDASTGNVFKPNGLLSYNEPEMILALADKEGTGPLWSKAIWSLAILSVVASMVLAWRSWRRS
ncbi:MAG: hypothetical protein ACOYPS_02925 [Phycisphaerales bacterium]|jgi:hypothetical protein